MTDEIINELWEIKDAIAREHGYDLDALAAHLKTRTRPKGQRVVDLDSMKKGPGDGAPADPEKPRG